MLKRPIKIIGGVGFVPLTRGHVAWIDPEQASFIGQWNWSVTGPGLDAPGKQLYAVANIEGRLTRMHRLLLGLAPDDPRVADHIDGNGLDNREANLRIATHSQNSQNSKIRSHNKTGFKGVSWNASRLQYDAHIMTEGKAMHLGSYATPEEGFAAYSVASRLLHGRFGKLR